MRQTEEALEEELRRCLTRPPRPPPRSAEEERAEQQPPSADLHLRKGQQAVPLQLLRTDTQHRSTRHGIVVAYSMGMGKTATAVETMKCWWCRQLPRRLGDVVICVPTTVLMHWKREMIRWEPTLFGDETFWRPRKATHLTHHPGADTPTVHLIGHDRFAIELHEGDDHAFQNALFIMDEAHELRNAIKGQHPPKEREYSGKLTGYAFNPEFSRIPIRDERGKLLPKKKRPYKSDDRGRPLPSRAFLLASYAAHRANYVLLLTGTPMYNHPWDIIPLWHVVRGEWPRVNPHGWQKKQIRGYPDGLEPPAQVLLDLPNVKRMMAAYSEMYALGTHGVQTLTEVMGQRMAIEMPGDVPGMPQIRELEPERVAMSEAKYYVYHQKELTTFLLEKFDDRVLNVFFSQTRADTVHELNDRGVKVPSKKLREVAHEILYRTYVRGEKGIVYFRNKEAGLFVLRDWFRNLQKEDVDVEWLNRRCARAIRSNELKPDLPRCGALRAEAIVEAVRRHDIPIWILVGETNPEDRERIAAAFRTHEGGASLLASPAVAVGINLKGGRYALMPEPHFNKSELMQAAGRVARYDPRTERPAAVDMMTFLMTKPTVQINSETQRNGYASFEEDPSKPNEPVDEVPPEIRAQWTGPDVLGGPVVPPLRGVSVDEYLYTMAKRKYALMIPMLEFLDRTPGLTIH